jgi:hypothetical protein
MTVPPASPSGSVPCKRTLVFDENTLGPMQMQVEFYNQLPDL